jgi:hypothetical protein
MKRIYILPLFLIFQIIFNSILSYFPDLVEKYYSNGIYPYISNFSRILFGKFSFSVGDVLYFFFLIYVIFAIWKSRYSWISSWKHILLKISGVFSVIYFLFHITWGYNYYRVPLFEKMKIQRDYSDKDLLDFTLKLIKQTNKVHLQITNNENLKVVFPYSVPKAFEKTLNGYNEVSKEYVFFSFQNLSIKKSLFSLPLTYMGFGGYLNPFTNEAQVNSFPPMYNFPMTSCHEMAHQIGFASESECNFIGFLTTIHNKDLYFQYAGYSYALRYCLANWEYRNVTIQKFLAAKINSGILNNYQESTIFWNNHETFIEYGFKVFYDNFLKLNLQEDGLDSYSKYLNLLINYYAKKDF